MVAANYLPGDNQDAKRETGCRATAIPAKVTVNVSFAFGADEFASLLMHISFSAFAPSDFHGSSSEIAPRFHQAFVL